ncbi:MAG TPA: cytochrome b [Burkholderiales bacterium]|jgi:cytochrome b561|nr:cytochrome b [Burkholderiales bacterium]
MLANTAESWGTPAKFFHWTVAVLILVQIALGFTAAAWRLSPMKLELFVWHKSTGVLILVLMLARLAWRLGNPSPALPANTPPWERTAAHASHALLYGLALALPLSGWVINSAAGVPFSVFWLVPLPSIVAPDERLEELAKLAHLSLLIALCLVLAVHIGAALRHHFIKRDSVLLRMLPETWRHA